MARPVSGGKDVLSIFLKKRGHTMPHRTTGGAEDGQEAEDWAEGTSRQSP